MPRRRNVASTMILDLNSPKSIKSAMVYAKAMERSIPAIERKVTPALITDMKRKIFGPMLRKLRVYPPRKRGMKIRWKNARQRRAVMALLRYQAKQRGEKDDISYKRSNRLKYGWAYTLTRRQRRIQLIVENKALAPITPYSKRVTRYSEFVQGRTGVGGSRRSIGRYEQPIQPFHADRGWSKAHEIIRPRVAQAKEYAKEQYIESLEGLNKKHGDR